MKSGTMFDKPMPTAPEAEMMLLGSFMLDPSQIEAVQPIRRDDFYDERHGTIYEAIAHVYDAKGDAFDAGLLADRLRVIGAYDQIGGQEYLIELASSTPTAVNAPHYAAIVRDRASIRAMIDALSTGLHESYHFADHGPDAVREIADRTEGRLHAITDRAKGDPTVGMESLAEILQAEAERLCSDHPSVAVPTRYTDLDEKLGGGFYPGEFIVIGARPSMGKTALSMNIAENIAAHGTPVGILSMEMSRAALSHRLIANAAGVPLAAMRGGKILTDDQRRAMLDACEQVKHYPLFIDDTGGLSVTLARTKVRRMVQRHGVRVVVIDYLQLMTAPGAKESRQVEVSAISRGLKALAKECGIPVVCLSQLNRANEARADQRPRMADLRESGSIEQDADVVMMLHREEYYRPNEEKWRGRAELILAKQRNGPTGTVKLAWNSERTRFESAYWTEEQDERDPIRAETRAVAGYGMDREPAPVYAPGDIWGDKAGGAA